MMINPNFATKIVGDFDNDKLHSITKGDCYLRCLYIKDKQSSLFITLDNWAIEDSIILQIKALVHSTLGQDVFVVVSSSFSYLTPILNQGFGLMEIDKVYAKFLLDRVQIVIKKIRTKPVNLSIAHQYQDDVAILVNQQSTSLLRLHVVSFLDQDNYIGHWIIYNINPSMQQNKSNHFSCDVMGLLLSELSRQFPGEFFMGFIGAGAEISHATSHNITSYQQALTDSKILLKQVLEIMANQHHLNKATLNLKQQSIWLHPQVKLIKAFVASDEQTIKQASNFLPKIKANQQSLPLIAEITNVKLGPIKLVFHPFSLVSWYQKSVSTDTILIGYSNGYAGVATQINQQTMLKESIFEIINEGDKRILIQHLQT